MDMEVLQKSASDPVWDAEETKLVYTYPVDPKVALSGEKFCSGIPADELYRTDPFLCARSPQTHIGPFKWAVDFLVPDGSLVYAAQDGEVIEVSQNSTRWGDGEEFRDDLNYLTIQHRNGECSQYCHLAAFSPRDLHAYPRRIVKQGQPIARVGKSGWTDRDHLHFVVLRPDQSPQNPFGFKSLKVRF
mgnify:CR=1 FL=1